MRKKLIATELAAKKGLKYPRNGYQTRRLMAGDTFFAPMREARLFMRMGFAYEAREAAVLPHPPADLVAKILAPAGDLSALRKAYYEKFDKRPGPNWDAETLAKKIAEA